MTTISSPPQPGSETVLRDAYFTLKNSKDGPKEKGQNFEKIEKVISGPSKSPTLKSLDDFYQANSAIISSAAAGLYSLDNKTIDSTITGFSETVKVVMKGLDTLKSIHPFIAVAVVAFQAVVTLDLTRRGNNQKVLAVNVQMQQMMCTLFQLRQVKDPDVVGPDGTKMGDRIQPLMEQIARDIQECGSDCDVYQKKSFIKKTLKSKIYEERLARYAAKFMDYREQIDKALTVHIALVVDAANDKLAAQATQLEYINEKMAMLITVFRRLDTQREKDVLEFIEQSGGAQAIVERNDLVKELVEKSGETLSNLAGKARGKDRKTDEESARDVREMLKKEIAEDVNAVFKQNLEHFESKLEIQSRNILDAFHKQNDYVVNRLSAGSHDKIKDRDLQNLWREMGGKGSVKARHFVLALRDYFTEKFSASTPHPNGLTVSIPSPLTSANEVTLLPMAPPTPHVDQWTLRYINVSKLNAILEAIDDDGTGFISVKEANTFANERPKGWSLLQWIAFWAQGWETSLADYKNKILLILQEMNRLHHDVLVENKREVDFYLEDPDSVLGIHLVLQSTKLPGEFDEVAPELLSVTQDYTASEEQRLQKNLEKIRYDLDSPATVTLVTGPGRIERYLFPLLYLILKRHLEVFQYAQVHLVDIEEFSHMYKSLRSIFEGVKHRIDNLRAITKQVHLDLNAHLTNFCFGIFHDYALHDFETFKWNHFGPDASLIVSWRDTSKTKNEGEQVSVIENLENAKPLFMTKPMGNAGPSEEWRNWPLHSFDTNPMTGGIDGLWAGHLWSTSTEENANPPLSLGLTQLKLEFDLSDGMTFKGAALSYYIGKEVSGRLRRLDDGTEEFDLSLSPNLGDYQHRLIGRYVKEDEILVGSWLVYKERDDAKKAYDDHPFSLYSPENELSPDKQQQVSTDTPTNQSKFLFRRTPAEVIGFWKLSDTENRKDPKRRWQFLREAVLYLVRRRLGSWTHIKARVADRRTIAELYKREWFKAEGLWYQAFTPEEQDVLWNLRYRLCPSIIRPFIECIDWSLNRCPWQYGTSCDGCYKFLVDERLICLTCLDPDVSMTFDLCPDCMDKPAERDEFTHSPEHTTIKCRQYPQPYFFSYLVKEARSMAKRFKKTMGESVAENQDNLGLGEHHTVSSNSQSELQCACCTKPVTIPCWACVVCASDTLICEDCEKKKAPVSPSLPVKSSHRVDHPLVRLHNTIPVRFQKDKLDPSVARINELESAFKEKFVNLDNQIANLDNRMVNLETKVGEKLTAFESLLKKIATQLNVPAEE